MGKYTRETQKRNFEHHLGLINKGLINKDGIKLEVTHSFSKEICLKNGDVIYPYKEIFFKQKSLLSYAYRELYKLGNERKPSANVIATGLEEFVFGYLGSHESYYGGKDSNPSFGVFISNELEDDLSTNATRRDLDSPDVAGIPSLDIEFLSPLDARSLLPYEIALHHSDDVWRYWGSPNYIHEVGYCTDKWKWKYEMHFKDKVDMLYIKAVIWPMIKKIPFTGSTAVDDISEDLDEMRYFHDLYPDIKIYTYDWTSKKGAVAFLNASHFLSEYYDKFSKYPEGQHITYE